MQLGLLCKNQEGLITAADWKYFSWTEGLYIYHACDSQKSQTSKCPSNVKLPRTLKIEKNWAQAEQFKLSSVLPKIKCLKSSPTSLSLKKNLVFQIQRLLNRKFPEKSFQLYIYGRKINWKEFFSFEEMRVCGNWVLKSGQRWVREGAGQSECNSEGLASLRIQIYTFLANFIPVLVLLASVGTWIRNVAGVTFQRTQLFINF